MSRTKHVRAKRYRAPGDTTSNKKPDHGRRWFKRFLRYHDVAPHRDEKRRIVDDE